MADDNVFETSTHNNSDMGGGQVNFYVHSYKFDLDNGRFSYLSTRFMDTGDYFDYAK